MYSRNFVHSLAAREEHRSYVQPSRQSLNISKPNLSEKEDDIFHLCNKISSQSNKNVAITTMKTFQLMKHARLFQNILGIPRMIKKPGIFGKSWAFSENARLFRLKLRTLDYFVNRVRTKYIV
jgi:hypothetical protein